MRYFKQSDDDRRRELALFVEGTCERIPSKVVFDSLAPAATGSKYNMGLPRMLCILSIRCARHEHYRSCKSFFPHCARYDRD